MQITSFHTFQRTVQAALVDILFNLQAPLMGDLVAVKYPALCNHIGAAAAQTAICLNLGPYVPGMGIHPARINEHQMPSFARLLNCLFGAVRNQPRLFRQEGSVNIKKQSFVPITHHL